MKDPDRPYSPFVVAAVAVYVFASYCFLLLGRETIDKLIEEDGFVEWLGTVGLFVGAGCFLWVFAISGRSPLRERYGLWKRLALLALAVVLFVAAGEEISWGQRLFGIATPDSLGSVSTQDETNLHNIEFFQNSINDDRLFQLFWIGFAVAVPLLSRFWEPARRLFGRFLPIFPVVVALLFVFNQAVETAFQWLLERHTDLYHSTYAIGSSSVEIVESNVGLLLGMGALAVLRSARREQAGAVSDAESQPAALSS